MSRQANAVTIHRARNGFMVEEWSPSTVATASDPWVFESFDSMIGWLRENYVEGEQPNDD